MESTTTTTLFILVVLVIGSFAERWQFGGDNRYYDLADKRALNAHIRKSSILWGKRSGDDIETKRTIPGQLRKSSMLWGKRSGLENEMAWAPDNSEDLIETVKRSDMMERVAKGALRPKLALSSIHWG
ncbi:unnamed protein product [Caenorhabditis angaria]|uniref:Uncharacterized protein n=1 Tax=Caenorhabditis angaria TaxID=860376 RepID=A0A9P1NC63_9PELO|nr:unnamed protein product [Caenorhabditis angaria]